jgi:hypothetical protein
MSATLANSPNKEVQLQPGNAVQVQFVLIVARPRGADLSYKMDLLAVLETGAQKDHSIASAGGGPHGE